jgi:hypothetical protein
MMARERLRDVARAERTPARRELAAALAKKALADAQDAIAPTKQIVTEAERVLEQALSALDLTKQQVAQRTANEAALAVIAAEVELPPPDRGVAQSTCALVCLACAALLATQP